MRTRIKKHKNCHRKPSGQGITGGKCKLCNQEGCWGIGEVYICQDCMIKLNLCYICGKELNQNNP